MVRGYPLGGIDADRTERHHLPDFARVKDGRLLYDGGQMTLPID